MFSSVDHGVMVEGVNVFASNLMFSNNGAQNSLFDGAGMVLAGGSVRVSNAEFRENTLGRSGRGAGLFVAADSALIENSTFIYNEALNGAAIYSLAFQTTLKNSILRNNILIASFEV